MPKLCPICGHSPLTKTSSGLRCENCGKELTSIEETFRLIAEAEQHGAAFAPAKREAVVWFIMRSSKPGKFAGPFYNKELAEERCRAMNEDVAPAQADFFVAGEL